MGNVDFWGILGRMDVDLFDEMYYSLIKWVCVSSGLKLVDATDSSRMDIAYYNVKTFVTLGGFFYESTRTF